MHDARHVESIELELDAELLAAIDRAHLLGDYRDRSAVVAAAIEAVADR